MINIQNKLAVITGAGGYIGSAIADALAKAGCMIIAIDSSKSNLSKLKIKITKKYNTNIKTICVDLSNEKNIKKVKLEILKDFNYID